MRSIPSLEFLYPCGVCGGMTILISACTGMDSSDRHDRLASNDSDDLLAFVRMERNHLARLVERHPNRHRASTDLAIDDHR